MSIADEKGFIQETFSIRSASSIRMMTRRRVIIRLPRLQLLLIDRIHSYTNPISLRYATRCGPRVPFLIIFCHSPNGMT